MKYLGIYFDSRLPFDKHISYIAVNIKIAKAYRTISFEASCMMAGFPPIGIVMEEKTRLYKIKHNSERCEYDCDVPLPVKEWPHPARRLNIMEIRDSTPDCTEI
jgi:hypothetical protein